MSDGGGSSRFPTMSASVQLLLWFERKFTLIGYRYAPDFAADCTRCFALSKSSALLLVSLRHLPSGKAKLTRPPWPSPSHCQECWTFLQTFVDIRKAFWDWERLFVDFCVFLMENS
jgi:hypothetical protein